MERAAAKLDVSLHPVSVTDTSEVDAALRAVTETDDQAIITMEDAFIASQRARIIDAAMRHHLPVMGEFRLMTEAGGLMSYGPNQLNMWHRTAYYLDKIFKGVSPADLPIEQPTKFELVINLKTAKELGLAIPPALLATADEVIE
jgi:putative ABC transport system substrate-binding protein